MSKLWCKKLVCAHNNFCSTVFATISGQEPDKSMYIFTASSIDNWEILINDSYKASIHLPDDRAMDVVCKLCKNKIGLYQFGRITLMVFNIKMAETEKIGES